MLSKFFPPSYSAALCVCEREKEIDLDRKIVKKNGGKKKGASVSHQRPAVFSFIFSLSLSRIHLNIFTNVYHHRLPTTTTPNGTRTVHCIFRHQKKGKDHQFFSWFIQFYME